MTREAWAERGARRRRSGGGRSVGGNHVSITSVGTRVLLPPTCPSPCLPTAPPPPATMLCAVQVMGLLGAKVEWSPYSITITGPSAFGRPIAGIDHDCNDIPDAAMTLAVAALFADKWVGGMEQRRRGVKGVQRRTLGDYRSGGKEVTEFDTGEGGGVEVMKGGRPPTRALHALTHGLSLYPRAVDGS